ncbi:MAG TPA: putative sulfate exporter family transporter [Clostridia bacterium]
MASKVVNGIFGNEKLKDIIPGLFLAVVLTLAAYLISNVSGMFIPGDINPFSPTFCAMLLGLLVGNIITLDKRFSAGIKFGLKKILRLGIVLMGIRLSILSVLKIGTAAVVLVLACIVSALIITIFLTKKANISKRLGILIAAGTSICGVSAIAATSPVIDADEEETSYAIGTITVFGLLATLIYPYLTELVLGLDVVQAGFFIGTSIHDTSQVTGAALMYDQLWAHMSPGGLSGADIAITTKLVRNTFMIAVIPMLGYIFSSGKEKGGKARLSITSYVPFFVFGYVLFGVLRTIGDFAFGDESLWVNIWNTIKDTATYLITAAMVCVGLNTNVKKLTKLGYKPLVVGLISAVSVGLVSFLIVVLFGSYIRF